MKKSFQGFTLLEVIIVTVIIGILAALGLASYAGPKEQATEREAQANLKLISSAEKVFRMEIGQYIQCNNTSEINNNLRLMLSTSDLNWKYRVDVPAGNATFWAKAQRNSGPSKGTKRFCIDETQDNSTNGTCGGSW